MADLPEYVENDQDLRAYRQGYRLDDRYPEHVRNWFQTHLVHFQDDWADQPFVLLDWQYADIIRPLYGWTRDGIRRFRYLWLWCGVKNGKTALISGLQLYELVATRGGFGICAAYDQSQAAIAHDACIHMGERSPALAPHLRMNRALHRIHLDADAGEIRAISQDAFRLEGYNISCASCDEIHTWSHGKGKGFAFWQTMDERTKARTQPLMLHTSTAGIYDPESFGWQMFDRCRKVLAGQIEDIRSLVRIYQADPKAEIDDPEAHRAANPSLGVTISAERMMEEARAAKTSGDVEAINKFKRYSLNQWVSAAEGWILPEDWKACAERGLQPDPDLVYYGGLDLASHDDLASFAIIAQDDEGIYRCHAWFWAPEAGANKRQAEGIKLLTWSEKGDVFLMPGQMIDPNGIQEFIVNLCQTYCILEIGFDPFQALQLATTLLNVHGVPMVTCPQTCKHYNEPCRSLEALLKTRRLRHPDHPILNWNVSNAELRRDPADHIMPVKSGKRSKIDGLTAILMALGRLLFSDRGEVQIR